MIFIEKISKDIIPVIFFVTLWVLKIAILANLWQIMRDKFPAINARFNAS